MDGDNYEKVTLGTWENNAKKKIAKYVKIEMTKGLNDYAYAAEVDISGY